MRRLPGPMISRQTDWTPALVGRVALHYGSAMPRFVSLQSAESLICDAERILVVGCSGGGKTTLALKIAETFKLEYFSLDRDVRWLPGWQVRDRDEQHTIIRQLVSQDRWVMDGSSPSTFDIRLPRADLVIWVRVSRFTALTGLARRVMANYGRVRVAMAEGCPEPLPDREFLSYIWHFERDHAPRFLHLLDEYAPDTPTLVIKKRKEAGQLFRHV